jgi:hypothetical protein
MQFVIIVAASCSGLLVTTFLARVNRLADLEPSNTEGTLNERGGNE